MLHLGFDFRAHFVQELFAQFAAALDRLLHFFERFRVEVAEGQVFELAAHLAHAQAVGDGGVDIHGLARHAQPLFGRESFQRAHVVEPVGKLHQHHADVLDHGEEHLAEIFGLLLFARGELDAADFRHSLDDARDFRPELLPHALDGGGRVLHYVVEHPARQAHHVELHLRQHVRHFQGVRDERLARQALLRPVLGQRKLVRATQQRQVFARPRRLHLPNDVRKFHHGSIISF